MDVVYIDDIAIDLKPNTTIALTLQRVEIGDITKNYLSFTNTIKAPKTAKNNVAFRFANLEKSNSSYQYGYKSARIVQNGVETINGLALIKAVDNEYQINIYDDFISFNDFLGDKDLSYLDYGTQAWTNSAIDAARLNTSGFISAVMNWGHTSSVYVKDNYLPLYSYKTLIEKILTSIGYTLSGSILSNTDYTDLVCTPFGRFRYSAKLSYSSLRTTSVGYSDSATITVNQGVFIFTLGTTVSGFTNAPDTFICDIEARAWLDNITLSIDPFSGSGCFLRVRAFNGVTTRTIGLPDDIVLGTNTISTLSLTNVELINGEQIWIEVVFEKDPNYPSDLLVVQTSDNANTFLRITSKDVASRTSPKWPLLASNIRLTDVLKDFFVRFGIIYKKDLNTLILRTFEDVCTDTANAIDWTNKRLKDADSIAFQTSYAQVNNFLHGNAIKDKFLGAGFLNVANTSLSNTKDFYTSAFKNANRWLGLGYEVMTIPVYNATVSSIDQINDEAPFTIGTLKSRTNEGAVTFDTIARTDYKLAYFVDASKSKDSSFSYFIGKYYATFGRSLQQFKLCTYRYLLTDMDIASYDPHKMIYDNGSYYLINKISNYVSGKPTTVELLKIQ